MSDKVPFELVSPERLLLAVECDIVVLPGSDGDFAVLAQHAPLISTLRPGAIEVYEGDKVTNRMFVAGGFADVTDGRVTVLATDARKIEDLNRAQLEQDLKNAREDVEDAKDDDARAKCEARVDVIQAMLELAA